jgi:hypothetical protein
VLEVESDMYIFMINPAHTEATTLQLNIHNWQKTNGLRGVK